MPWLPWKLKLSDALNCGQKAKVFLIWRLLGVEIWANSLNMSKAISISTGMLIPATIITQKMQSCMPASMHTDSHAHEYRCHSPHHAGWSRIPAGESGLEHTSSPSHLSSPASLSLTCTVFQFLPSLSFLTSSPLLSFSFWSSIVPCYLSFLLLYIVCSPPTPPLPLCMKWLIIHSLKNDWPNMGHVV